MLNLRRETDYAIHMLVYLKNSKLNFVSLKNLSVATGISFLFLQKIARKMMRAELIESGKGVSGGYGLKISPKKLSLKKIIETIEGPINMLPCLCVSIKKYSCPNKGIRCSLSKKMGKANKKISAILNAIKLSDL